MQSSPQATGNHIPSIHGTQYRFVPVSNVPVYLMELKEIMETLTLQSITSPDPHLIIDTGALHSICSEDWLKKTKWAALETAELSNKTPLLRFAGHPVCTSYGIIIATTIIEIQGHQQFLKIFFYVLPPMTLPSILGLTDQSRLGFDIRLRERHPGHLRISAPRKVFPLVVTSNVLLHFEPFACISDGYP